MSADNGIYILRTLNSNNSDGFEYRVTHAQGIDNIYWNKKKKDYDNNNSKNTIKNARDFFKNCKVLNSYAEAYMQASEIYNNYPFTEYGVCLIQVDEVF